MQEGLVKQAQRGDADAFDSLARLVGDRCLAIAVRILRDMDLAEDAVQGALITAWRKLRTLRDPARFEPSACSARVALIGAMVLAAGHPAAVPRPRVIERSSQPPSHTG